MLIAALRTPHTTSGYGTGISMVHPFRSMAGTEFTE